MNSTVDEVASRAERLINEGSIDEALSIIENTLSRNPDTGKLWHLRGVAYGTLGRHKEALGCFERCIELHPKLFTAWYHKAVALAALGDQTRAIDAYREARRLDPTDASSAFNLGVELRHSAPVEALEHLDDADSLGHPRARAAADAIRQRLRL